MEGHIPTPEEKQEMLDHFQEICDTENLNEPPYGNDWTRQLHKRQGRYTKKCINPSKARTKRKQAKKSRRANR